jgi:hypothetical protein
VRTAIPLVLALLVPCGGAFAGPDGLSWKLGLSDVAVYDRKTITLENGKERPGRASPFTVYGHDLRDAGQYMPGALARGGLPAMLALRLPTAGRVEMQLAPAGVIDVRFTGTFTTAEEKPGEVSVAATWSFGSRGRQDRSDTHWIRDGTATVRSVFDRKAGVLRSSRVEISYALGKTDAKPGERPKRVTLNRTYGLKHVRRARYDEFQEHVDAAIARGVKHLRTLQRENGGYEPHGNWTVGTTALAVLTLASCDVPVEDPAVENGLAFICGQSPRRTYAQALSLMALDKAYTPAWERLAERTRRLESFQRKLPPRRMAWARRVAASLESQAGSPGTWGYPATNARALLKFDSSNTQYGVLGLRAAARLGIEIKKSTWTGVVRYFGQVRERKGPRGSVRLGREGEAVADGRETVADIPVPAVLGFKYSTLENHAPAWGSMTCAGIASLSIARDQLQRMGKRHLDRATDREIEELVLSGWAWLDAHWAIDRHPRKPGTAWYYYWLYSLERAGILSCVRTVGGKDWYFEGAVQLIERQKKNGAWDERGPGNITETCFALLFLKRATAPITPSPR